MNSQSLERIAARSADPDVKSFLQALTSLHGCAARVSGLDQIEIVAGLDALNHDAKQQLERMLQLMDDIERSFMRIRRKLNPKQLAGGRITSRPTT